eukprot:Skav235984  [mRNA]  locus=scaffold592:415657:432540:- [translate_table: standard]
MTALIKGFVDARLTNADLALTEDTDIPNPREHMAITRIQECCVGPAGGRGAVVVDSSGRCRDASPVDSLGKTDSGLGLAPGRAFSNGTPASQEPDDRKIFEKHDVDEMLRTYDSPVAKATLSPKATSMAKAADPAFGDVPLVVGGDFHPRTLISSPLVPPAAQRNPLINKLEDSHFSYFVPKNLQREHRDRLNMSGLSKLKKANMISFPFSGEGTGFRSQGSLNNWFPSGSYTNVPTSYRIDYSRPAGFFRATSPFLQARQTGGFGVSAVEEDLK